jgi:hypothetical protein
MEENRGATIVETEDQLLDDVDGVCLYVITGRVAVPLLALTSPRYMTCLALFRMTVLLVAKCEENMLVESSGV